MTIPKVIRGASWMTPKGSIQYLRSSCISWTKAIKGLDTISFRIVKRTKN